MAIYTNHSFPYVYMGIHKTTNQFYVGVRTANKVQSHLDLGVKYHTSSRYVREIGFDNFEWVIIAEFFAITAIDDAYWFEQELIQERFDDPGCLNKHYTNTELSQKKFNMAGVKHSQAYKDACSMRRTGTTLQESTKAKQSAALTGKKHTQEHIANNVSSRKKNGKKQPPLSTSHASTLKAAIRKFYDDPAYAQARLERNRRIGKAQTGMTKKSPSLESVAKRSKKLQKPISCDGMLFGSRAEAAIYFKVRPETISARVKSKNPLFAGYFYIKKTI